MLQDNIQIFYGQISEVFVRHHVTFKLPSSWKFQMIFLERVVQ